jgi:hypothetical protein
LNDAIAELNKIMEDGAKKKFKEMSEIMLDVKRTFLWQIYQCQMAHSRWKPFNLMVSEQ